MQYQYVGVGIAMHTSVSCNNIGIHIVNLTHGSKVDENAGGGGGLSVTTYHKIVPQVNGNLD